MNDLSTEKLQGLKFAHLQKLASISLMVESINKRLDELVQHSYRKEHNKSLSNLKIIINYSLNQFKLFNIFYIKTELIKLDRMFVNYVKNVDVLLNGIEQKQQNPFSTINLTDDGIAEIKENTNNFIELIDELSIFHNNLVEKKITNYNNKLSEIDDKRIKLDQKFDETFLELNNQVKTLEEKEIANCKQKIDNLEKKEIEGIKNQINANLQQLEELNAGTNRLALAKFFKSESRKLNEPSNRWLIAVGLGILLLLGSAYETYNNQTQIYTLVQYASRVPLFMVLIWMVWFCSKQYSYTVQIRDEYEYKYALSMSYLGYRKEAMRMVDDKNKSEILPLLLGAIINNIAASPVQSIKKECHTPFGEILSNLKDVSIPKPDTKG